VDAEGRHLERIEWRPSLELPPDLGAWPFTIPAVAQLVDEGGLEVPPGITFPVGENGSGKSTLVEAFAAVCPRHGFATPHVDKLGPGASAEDSPLPAHIRARTRPHASPAGLFLRAEAMHSYLARIDSDPSQARAWGGERMSTGSHGEAFLEVLRHRFADIGVYFMDEPEAAFSFRSCLALVALLDQMRSEGSQVVVATHSPLIASLPGATLIEVGDRGFRRVERYDDLDLVDSWRTFMAPARDVPAPPPRGLTGTSRTGVTLRRPPGKGRKRCSR
jgi:predicted ATPase